MGTSGPYTPSPKWSDIKTDVSNALNSGSIDGEQAQALVGDFVQRLCDDGEEGFGSIPSDFGDLSPDEATEKLDRLLTTLPELPPLNVWRRRRVSSGQQREGSRSGSVSGAKTGRGGRRNVTGSAAVRPTARRLATFLSEVPKLGLRQALLNAGITSIDDLPPDKIALAVADVLAGEASLLIEAELRDALAQVMDEICQNPQTFEDAELMLSDSAYNLENILQLLFECYIMERFKTFFCEHESKKHGYAAADKILKEAREFVATEMQLERSNRRDLTAVDWDGPDGAKIIDAILERTIAVYTET
jgi:hypothetical protein